MQVITKKISEINSKITTEATFTSYLRGYNPQTEKVKNRRTMIILAGGGYNQVSPRCDEPVAMKFLAEGYNVFTVNYSTKPITHPAQVMEVGAVINYIRENADELMCNVEQIAIMGFSAGGHLAMSVTCLSKEIAEMLDTTEEMVKTNACVLCYSVASLYVDQISQSILRVSGFDEELAKTLSCESLIKEGLPPFFVWHTTNDTCVPIGNTMNLMKCLVEKGISTEVHVFDDGFHGLSICEYETHNDKNGYPYVNEHASQWLKLCFNWLEKTLNYSKYTISGLYEKNNK